MSAESPPIIEIMGGSGLKKLEVNRKNVFEGLQAQVASASGISEQNQQWQVIRKKQEAAPKTVFIGAVLAEFIGTFVLIYAGQGIGTTSPSPLEAAFAISLTLMVLIAAFAHISQAHFNPALTLALVYNGTTDAVTGIVYVITQVAAAVAATAMIDFHGLTLAEPPALADGIEPWSGLVAEFIFTFLLITVIIESAFEGHGGPVAPLYCGLTVGATIIWGGAISGGVQNPVAYLGPAIVTGIWRSYGWIYVVGTMAGGLAASVLHVHLWYLYKTDDTGTDDGSVTAEQLALLRALTSSHRGRRTL